MLFYLGVFSPAFVAVALTARHEGRSGVGALLGRLIQWRAGLRWYVFAPTYMAAIKLTAAPEGVAARLADGQFAVDLCRFFLLRMRANFGRRRR